MMNVEIKSAHSAQAESVNQEMMAPPAPKLRP